MIQVNRRNSFSRIITLCAAFLLAFSSSLFAQIDAATGDADAGKALFKTNCAACHKLYKPMTGPALFNVVEKYEEDYEWLGKWIRNSQELIKAGDARAVKVYEENGQKVLQMQILVIFLRIRIQKTLHLLLRGLVLMEKL